MLFTTLLAAFAAIPFASAKKDLTKPVMNPPLRDMSDLNLPLLQKLPLGKFSTDKWGRGWLPKRCKEGAEAENLNPNDMEAWNVMYSDCGSPWVLCRHKDAQLSVQEMVHYFGILPVRMRDHVQHLMAFPGNGWAQSWYNTIGFYGSVGASVFVHEVAHNMDRWAFNEETPQFSSSKVWLTEFAKDAAVVSDYARTNQVENFADEFIVALLDRHYPGGIGSVTPGWGAWSQVFHQYATIQWKAGDKLYQGGSCNRKFQNTPPVATTRRRGPVLGPAPAYLVEGDHDFIDPVEFADIKPIKTVFDKNGNVIDSIRLDK